MVHHRRRAAVYNDEGVSPLCVKCTCKTLHSYKYSTVLLTAQDIKCATWTKSCDLIVFPGGRDTPYHEKLSGRPNQIIKDFIKKGGRYLGICAGGYYGSKNIEFCHGNPEMEIQTCRELELFHGTAVGPVYPGFKYTDNTGEHVVEVCNRPCKTGGVVSQTDLDNRTAKPPEADIHNVKEKYPMVNGYDSNCRDHRTNHQFFDQNEYNKHQTYESNKCQDYNDDKNHRKSIKSEHVYFNGGCYFRPGTGTNQKYTILRNYVSHSELSAESAAVIGMNVGQGKVVLSGVHPEIGYEDLVNSAQHLPVVVDKMRECDEERISVLQDIFRFLGLNLNVKSYAQKTQAQHYKCALI